MRRSARIALPLAAIALASCMKRSDVVVTPVAPPRADPSASTEPPPDGRTAIRAELVVDGPVVTGTAAWTAECLRPAGREVEYVAPPGLVPDTVADASWLAGGAVALGGGVALFVAGARGGDGAEARAIPPGILLSSLGLYALGAAIDGLSDARPADVRSRTTERVEEPARVACGDDASLGHVVLGLSLADGRVVPSTRGRAGRLGFALPAGAAGRARLVALEDPSRRLSAGATLAEVALPPAAPEAPLHFAPGSPSIAGDVASFAIARGGGRPEVCDNLEDDDGDGFYDVGCGFRAGSLSFTLGWSAPEDLDLEVTGPDGVAVSAAHPTGGDAGLALDRDAHGAEPGHPAIENVTLAPTLAPRPGTYRAVVTVARSSRTGASVVAAKLAGRALGRAFRADLALPARVGERAEVAITIAPGPPDAPRVPLAPALAAGGRTLGLLDDRGVLSFRGEPLGGPVEDLGDPASSLAVGPDYACVVRASGHVACSGMNLYARTSRRAGHDGPTVVAGLEGVTRVACGHFHACALDAAGDVSCWGRAEHGELGPAAAKRGVSPDPTPIPGLSGARAITAGEGFSCALRADGHVACWGDGALGQLGDGLHRASPTPVLVAGLDDAIAVAAGRLHACALRATGEAVCWGYGFDGQLGDGGWKAQHRPVAVRGLEPATRLAAGGRGACAIVEGGRVLCWGEGLADGARGRRTTPELVHLAGPAEDIAVGDGFACALVAGKPLACWGERAPR